MLFFLLTALSLAILAPDALATLRSAPRYPAVGSLYFLLDDLLLGMWVVWLQARLAGRFRGSLKLGLVSGTAWWVVKSLESLKWVALGFVPVEFALRPGITSLMCSLLAAVGGAFLYSRSGEPAGAA